MYGVSQNYGYHFGGPRNQDDSIWVLYRGSPFFGKLLYVTQPYGIFVKKSSHGPVNHFNLGLRISEAMLSKSSF